MKLLAHFVPSGEGETTSILNQLQPQRWLPCAPFVKRVAFRGSICSLWKRNTDASPRIQATPTPSLIKTLPARDER